nr:hypothetical protein REQ54_00808 [Rhizobium sp. Q54]
MTEILVKPIKAFPLSGRVLCLTEEAGMMTGGVHKDGSPLARSFSSGAVALQEKDGACAVAPLDLHAAVEFAERLIEGDARAITEPGAVLMLATALVAIVLSWPVPAMSGQVDAAEAA